ncbi:MAG: 50S ribosomal protein L11 methyltransferase, partial [Acutalibacteraceae bacterium]
MTEDQYKFEETDFNEIIFTVPSEKTEAAGDIANMAVPYGIYIEDYRDLERQVDEIAHIDLIDDELLKKDRTRSMIHIYKDAEKPYTEAVSFVEERFRAENIVYETSVRLCKTEDWANNWKKYFHPIKIGEKLLICPSWEEKPETDRKILTLEPGLAFGTGTHETTALCLEMVEKYTKKDDAVLDVGTGSGILST